MEAGNVGRAAILFAELGIGGEQDHVQLDRVLAIEVVLQVAELISRLAVHVEDLELLLADRDHPLDAIVIFLELAGLRINLDDVDLLAGYLGSIDQLDAIGLAVAGRIDLLGFQDPVRPGIVAAGVPLFEPDRDLLALEPAHRQLGLEAYGVVDEDHVVDEEFGQFEIAGRLRAPQPDRVERHSLACRQVGRLGERLTFGRLPVGKEHDRRGRCAPELGEDLPDSVAEPGLRAGGLERPQ